MKFRLFKGIIEGNMYACLTGDFAGQMFMYFDKNDTEYEFLSVPTMINHQIPKDVFDNGLKSGIVEYVERPPRHVRNICKIQFQENRKNL